MVSISFGVPARWVLEDGEIDMTEGCLVRSPSRVARRRWEVGVLVFGVFGPSVQVGFEAVAASLAEEVARRSTG